MTTIKVLKKGLKDSTGKYYPARYSISPLLNYPQGTITVYAKSRLPKELNPENKTDMMTDYFENDRARIIPTHPLYNEFLKVVQS